MKITAKYLLVALLCTVGAVQAGRSYEADYSNDNCCRSSCYECGCNPLYCGAWDLQIQAGVNPITWRHRGQFVTTDCTEAFPLASFGEIKKFSHYFKTPWIVGGQVGYHWSDNARVYFEFNYSQAKSKSEVDLFDPGAAAVTANFFSKYKLFDAYVGARHYWDRWCDRVAFFLGAKVGLTHHKSVDANLTIGVTTTDQSDFFDRNTVVSGGADFGFDVCFCGNWSFVVTGAVIASCGPDGSGLGLTLAPTLPENVTLLVTNVRTELRFPVTAGIRYSF